MLFRSEVGKAAELTQKDILEKLDTMKLELSEKVHNENVKCYRNVQALVEELKREMDQIEMGDRSMKAIKGRFGAAIILGVANLAGILGIAAHLMGLF